MFYGQKMKTFLQKSGETLYMPHLTLHSVWNLTPTIAIGDNPLYDSSFIDFIGSDGYEDNESLAWMRSRVAMLARKKGMAKVLDVLEQIKEYAEDMGLENYSGPLLWKADSTTWPSISGFNVNYA